MKLETRIDPDCSACHGKGEVDCGQWREGEYWMALVTCYCVTYHHDDEMKAFLARHFPAERAALAEQKDRTNG